MLKQVLILILLIELMTASPRTFASDVDPRLPPADKAAHFGISALGTASTLKVFEAMSPEGKVSKTARIVSSFLWLGIGVWKERYDSKRGGTNFDIDDMGADMVGVAYGNLLMVDF